MHKSRQFAILGVIALLLLAKTGTTAGQSALPKPEKDTVLKAADITAKLFPEMVFFRGQSAPVQMRNTGGVHFADDRYVLAGMVDNSGYSTGLREKYQAYMNTLQDNVNAKMPADRIPGTAIGMMMYIIAFQRVAPSMRAHSSSSRGIALK